MSPGKVWLVGAGPGDPGLLTLRGVEALRAADVVLHDALSHPALLEHCRPDAEIRDVGKRGGRQSPSQDWITSELVELARAGRRVVRLKGGDPLLFARGAEEIEALFAAGVPFEIVPGISSPAAASAYAGIPLTHRTISSSVTFITGTDRNGEVLPQETWARVAQATDTLCVLMGMRRLPEITEALERAGLPPSRPAAVVQWASQPEQRVLVSTLGDVAREAAREGLQNPALVIIGEVVPLRERVSWFERLPLFGRRVLVPRAAAQGAETARAIRERGGEPVLVPALRIVEPPDPAPLETALSRLEEF
ncbi:MAG: uroporphyrinogen-III C-methyltransferase, partial [Deltaproteobacteria bacterium]|nr:uroporphyrinogen-III C-methyltransferase [Deltaproteobacteria bacterium]